MKKHRNTKRKKTEKKILKDKTYKDLKEKQSAERKTYMFVLFKYNLCISRDNICTLMPSEMKRDCRELNERVRVN